MVCFPTILVDFVMANVGRYTIHGCYGKTEKKKNGQVLTCLTALCESFVISSHEQLG